MGSHEDFLFLHAVLVSCLLRLGSTYVTLPVAVVEPFRNDSYTSNEEQVIYQPTGEEFESSHRGVLASKDICDECGKGRALL